MELVSGQVIFKTKVGEVLIKEIEGRYFFEFISGYNFGLHNDVGTKTFDQCYKLLKSRMRGWIKEMEQYELSQRLMKSKAKYWTEEFEDLKKDID